MTGERDTAQPRDETVRQRVIGNRYALREPIGRGGMGTVWLASDGLLQRDVAVKEVTFPLYLTDDERALLRERTLREARAAARFQHPQATAVHDVVEEDGRPWIVMDFVPSRTLSALVRDSGPLSPHATARIGVDVLGVLQAAHRAGIVHRDVKPGNVLVNDEGRAWLTDFGIATSLGDTTLTEEGILLGSPSYMAPERAHPGEPGPASDLWSLGATLYSAVEGRPPFDRGEPMATLLAVASDEPVPFRAAGLLEPVLAALLQKDSARRPSDEQTMEQLVAVVGATVSGSAQGVAAPVRAAEPDAAGAERADGLQRVDRAALAALAASTGATTRAVARAAAHKAADKAVDKLGDAQAHAERSLAGRQSRRGRDPGPASAERAQQQPAAAPSRRQPPLGAPLPTAPPPYRGPNQWGPNQWGPNQMGPPPPPPQQRRRFKRRWVGIPLAVLLLVLLGAVGAVVLILYLVAQALTTAPDQTTGAIHLMLTLASGVAGCPGTSG